MKNVVLLTTFALAACGPRANSSNTSTDMTNAEVLADNLEAVAGNLAAGATAAAKDSDGGWTYDERQDEMRGATGRAARIESDKTLSLGFPYGETRPVLTVRQDPKFGFDIYITSEGQPQCNDIMDRGEISVKFDSGPVKEWSCARAADGSPGIVFFNSEKALLAKLKASRRMIVEIEYYNAGRQQFGFNVAGLKW